MSNLTYFLFIDDYKLDMSPEEEMMEYLKENCLYPSDEELTELEKEVWG